MTKGGREREWERERERQTDRKRVREGDIQTGRETESKKERETEREREREREIERKGVPDGGLRGGGCHIVGLDTRGLERGWDNILWWW